ncbi:hypothetical protein LJC08_06365 [Methanimicrococcus sp. OttesenSCG-928-J09]|nr:hypothetical protein [Methanimicrococcus sp. OttesenSCG-928-J09]
MGQVSVLQWEGGVYEKSLRDFCRLTCPAANQSTCPPPRAYCTILKQNKEKAPLVF